MRTRNGAVVCDKHVRDGYRCTRPRYHLGDCGHNVDVARRLESVSYVPLAVAADAVIEAARIECGRHDQEEPKCELCVALEGFDAACRAVAADLLPPARTVP